MKMIMLGSSLKPVLWLPSSSGKHRSRAIVSAEFRRENASPVPDPNPNDRSVVRLFQKSSQLTYKGQNVYENHSGAVLLFISNIPLRVKRDEFHFLMQRLPGVETWQFISQGRGSCGKYSAGYAYCECPTMADAEETMALIRGFRVQGVRLQASLYQPRNVSWATYGPLKFDKNPTNAPAAAPSGYDPKMPSTGSSEEAELCVEATVAEADELKEKETNSEPVATEDRRSVPVKEWGKEWTYKEPRTYEEVQRLLKTKLKRIPDVNEVLQTRVPLRIFDRDKWLRERRQMRIDEEQKARANAALERVKKTERRMGPIRPPNKRLQLGYLRCRTKMGPNGELPF